jgi:hypothetical protein
VLREAITLIRLPPGSRAIFTRNTHAPAKITSNFNLHNQSHAFSFARLFVIRRMQYIFFQCVRLCSDGGHQGIHCIIVASVEDTELFADRPYCVA